MAIRKTTSTNFENEVENNNRCPVNFALAKIGGRWKPLILYQLSDGKKRYNEIKRGIPNVSEKMLIEKLKELENDGLICRKALPVVPPHVEYSLTENGQTLTPVLMAIAKWGTSQMA
ncbi:MAG: winged helix-turn-helix transcriptional regulator [Bacteroidota bacterium]